MFLLFGIVHAVRLMQGWSVHVGSMMIPLWGSGVAIAVALLFATWGFVLARRA
jgi:hypothetical protein